MLLRKDRRLLERVAANDPSLYEVDLRGKGIGDDGAKKLAEALRGNTTATALRLQDNGIGDDGAKDLADMLRHNSTITELYLNNTPIGLASNDIGAEGAKELSKMLLHNSAVTVLVLWGNDIGAEGAKELVKALLCNSTVTTLDLYDYGIGDEGDDIGAELTKEVYELVRINDEASSPQEALGLKVERLVASNDGGGAEAAVSLTLERLDTFPSADDRWELFGRLLGSERGREVAAAVDVATGRTLFWLAAECGAAPGALMSVLRAHPSLIACRDVRNRLFPFALLATMPTAGVGDVMELLLLNPALVEGGIS